MTILPLQGLTVIDWTLVAAGPATSGWLGCFGANVIKLEEAQRGDPSRYASGNVYGVPVMLKGDLSSMFEKYNTNKRSLAVNLKKPEAREAIYRLVEKADIFLTNQLPDTIDKLGMSYETLSKINPRLIYATNTIQGPKGPDRLLPGLDPLSQARGGILMTAGEQGGEPTDAPMGTCDVTSALSLFAGIMTALFYRERTGNGQWVQTSQLQTALNVMIAAPLGLYLLQSEEVRQNHPYKCIARAPSREDTLNPVANRYRCKDGRWIFITAFYEHHWPVVAKALGREDLIANPKFANLKKRAENRRELIQLLDNLFAEKTYDEWKEILRKAGGVPFSPVNTLDTIPTDDQIVANGYLVDFDHPILGQIKLPGMPFTLTKTPGSIRTAAPALGEHSEEILLELGYTWEDIETLRINGAI